LNYAELTIRYTDINSLTASASAGSFHLSGFINSSKISDSLFTLGKAANEECKLCILIDSLKADNFTFGLGNCFSATSSDIVVLANTEINDSTISLFDFGLGEQTFLFSNSIIAFQYSNINGSRILLAGWSLDGSQFTMNRLSMSGSSILAYDEGAGVSRSHIRNGIISNTNAANIYIATDMIGGSLIINRL
jgi:hypothetical protein